MYDNTPNANTEQICKALFFYCFLFQVRREVNTLQSIQRHNGKMCKLAIPPFVGLKELRTMQTCTHACTQASNAHWHNEVRAQNMFRTLMANQGPFSVLDVQNMYNKVRRCLHDSGAQYVEIHTPQKVC